MADLGLVRGLILNYAKYPQIRGYIGTATQKTRYAMFFLTFPLDLGSGRPWLCQHLVIHPF
jgi:hypothetical protein